MKSIEKLLQTHPDITPDDEENAEERIHASEIQQKVQAIAHISANVEEISAKNSLGCRYPGSKKFSKS